MKETKYIDLNRVMQEKDLDGKIPAIRMIETNRSSGKTTAALNLALERYAASSALAVATPFRRSKGLDKTIITDLTVKDQTVLIYRHMYELSSAGTIFSEALSRRDDIPNKEITMKSHAHGLFFEICLGYYTLGYAVSLSASDQLKKYSPIFAKVGLAIMDEFQLESGNYLKKEIEKFLSVMITVCRGGGDQMRDIDILLLSNKISMLNPYFIHFNIHRRKKPNSKYVRGNGWIAYFYHYKSAEDAIKATGLAKAFSGVAYMDYATTPTSLVDDGNFIEPPIGKSVYIFTLVYNNQKFGVREFFEQGKLYISKKPDPSCQTILTFTESDHNQTTMLIDKFSYLFKNIKTAYQCGYLYFDSMESKNAIFSILGIDILNH